MHIYEEDIATLCVIDTTDTTDHCQWLLITFKLTQIILQSLVVIQTLYNTNYIVKISSL